MTTPPSSPRALLHLLFNGARAMDVVEASLELGLLDSLEGPRPVTLAWLAQRHGLVPTRLYKLLDCLESLGLVRREQDSDALADTRYQAVAGLADAARGVLAREKDRDKFAWRAVYGRLPEVLRGQHGVPPEDFDWPLRTPEQVADFETSMAAGLPPILETLRQHAALLWRDGPRLLDVGGGDGSLAAHLIQEHPGLRADVFNLPATAPLVERTRRRFGLPPEQPGFVGGDFLQQPLPRGYDAISFVRVLHDWPMETARSLLKAAFDALPSGGRVLVCEEFRTPQRLAAQFFWTYLLIGVDSCASRLREVELYLDALRDTGFVDARALQGGPFELVTAVRP
ncbi:methyltransferase [Myxococcus stipitatus]|uniref:methyltransferase n=1 Tax=Myxococcus stipitatus TaxID=83455 RepID=UPI003AF294F2